MKRGISTYLVLTTMVCLSCGKEAQGPEPTFGNEELASIDGLNKVAFEIFYDAKDFVDGKSFVVSPASIAMVLGMEANTQEVNAEEINRVYGFTSTQAANELYSKLIDKYLYKYAGISTLLANACFNNANKGNIDSNTEAILKKNFCAGIYSCDFNKNKEVSDKIVSFVKSNTNGMIDLKQVDVNNGLDRILVNTVYFKGKWTHPFKSSNTTDKQFTCSDGSKISLPTMKQTYKGIYSSTDDFESVDMDYGKDKKYSMRVILSKGDKELTEAAWIELRHNGHLYDINIELPKFESSIEDYGTPFIYLEYFKALHTARIIVNEEGSEAAAVTVGMDGAAGPPRRVDFIVNRPFYYAIVDNTTGLILFMGYFNGK